MNKSSATFPLNCFSLPENTEEVVSAIWNELGSWRKFLLVLDGRSGLGKSVFARYLSYRLNFPHYELDEFKTGQGILAHANCLFDHVTRRLDRCRPVLVEGICAAKILTAADIKVDYIVRLQYPHFVGPEEFRVECAAYEKEYHPGFVARSKYCGDCDDWLEPA